MLGGEVVERQQSVPVFVEALGRFGVLGLVGLEEQVKRLVRLFSGIGHPDLMNHVFGVRLDTLGQLVQHVGHLVHPTALFPGLGKDLRQCLPETKHPVASGELGIDHQPTCFHIQQKFLSRLFALTKAVMHGNQLFFPFSGSAHQHQDALPIFFQADVEVDAIGPHIDVLLSLQAALVPLTILFLPGLFQIRNGRSRQSGAFGAEQRLQRIRQSRPC